MVKRCDACQQTRHNPSAVFLHPLEFRDGPWECVHPDFAGPIYRGKMLLILVDAHSKWMEVKYCPLQPQQPPLSSIFATHGIPKMFVTDKGTQFTSAEFAEFLE